eukprot:3954084-Prymnesium_polylepis.1
MNPTWTTGRDTAECGARGPKVYVHSECMRATYRFTPTLEQAGVAATFAPPNRCAAGARLAASRALSAAHP